jgi:anti-sigma B factor antagonist
MKIRMDEHKGVTVLSPSGDIDMYTSPELRKELLRIIGDKESPLLVNFKDVSYIDSSGIATFVEGLKTMKSYGGRLQLIGLPKAIMEIFRFSKLEGVFEIYGTLDDALNS